MDEPDNSNDVSVRRHLLVSAAAAGVLVFGFGVWAVATEFQGAVIANGQLVVDTNVKKVQHPTGGVVGEIRVRDGDKVKAGDLLVRLDEVQVKANLAIVTKAIDEMEARKAREEAERDATKSPAFPAFLTDRMSDPEVTKVVDGERRLFEIRHASRDGQRSQLRERVAQLRQEIAGIQSQEASKGEEADWIGQELEGVRELWKKSLVQFTRVTALERDRTRFQGERGYLVAGRAQAQGKIAETELQILQIDSDLRTEVGKDLADIRGKLSELGEKRVAAEDQMRRIDLRAPIDGTVLQMAVHTVGGVITANGEPVMLVVPDSDTLTVEARVQPQDIDQVHVGQKAAVRFLAFNQRTTPELDGVVSRVSADVSNDAKTGAAFYVLRISIPESEMARLDGLKLVPGMPVESFVQTSARTVATFLVRPLSDQVRRAFREK